MTLKYCGLQNSYPAEEVEDSGENLLDLVSSIFG
jgi:hypothetical protein